MAGHVLDTQGTMPLYHQLARLLRRKIMTGEFPVGSNLPSEAQLVSEYGISRVTVRQAVGVLVIEGLVSRASGRGTLVLAKANTHMGQKFSGSLSELIFETERSQVRNVQLRVVQAPSHISATLALNDPTVTCVSRTRLLDNEVFAYSVDYLPEPLGSLITEETFEHKSLMSFFAAEGIDMASARQSIRADIADIELAGRLKLHPGDPVLSVDRVIFNRAREPLFYVQTYYRGDRYTYTVELGLDSNPDSVHSDLA